jgi:signal transduction histidine kinase
VFRKIISWLPLMLALLLWLFAGWGSYRESRGRHPQSAAAIITQDLRQRQQHAQSLMQDHAAMAAWMQGQGSPATAERLSSQPFALFALRGGDSLSAWNTADLSPPAGMDSAGRLWRINGGAWYGYRVHRRWMPPGYSLCLLLPISRQFPFSNEYLQPSFAASRLIDPELSIADSSAAGAAPILSPDGARIAWLLPAPAGGVPIAPAGWVVGCWLLGLVLLVLWLHGWLALFARRGAFAWAALLVAALALGLRALLMLFGPPFHILESELFSPRLYASSASLSSLGGLLLHVLACLWVVLFIAPRLRFSAHKLHRWLRMLLAPLVCLALFAAAVLFVHLVRSLVLDSLIPFDRAHLSALDGSSLSGVLVVLLMLAILLRLLRLAAQVLQSLLPGLAARLAAIAAGALLLWLASGMNAPDAALSLAIGWLGLELLSAGAERWHSAVPGVRIICLAMAHCALLSLLLLHYTRQREAAARRHFAEHIAARHDDAMEYNFGQVLPAIRRDTVLRGFMVQPDPERRKALEEHLATAYFNDKLAAYQARVYLFDRFGRPLLNADSTTLESLQQIRERAVPSRTARHLYYRDAATDDHLYLALADIEDSLGNPLGTFAADLEQKKIVSETVLPELLQPSTVNQAEKAAGYSYAIYSGGRLVAQTSDYPFPFYIPHDTSGRLFRERRGKDASTLIYMPDAYRSVYVWRRFNTVPEALTLFSYLLLLRFAMLALGWVYRHRDPEGWWAGLRRGFQGMGLRRRLQLSIMGVVAVSFAGIGIVTILFLRQRYDDAEKDKRQAMMQVLTRGIQQWMKEQGADETAAAWNERARGREFGYFLTELAAAQKIDINLFDAQGRLVSTTQPAIFSHNLLAPLMRFDVLTGFKANPRSLLTEVERIGSLRYQSAYAPLRAEGGEPAGYLNVPLFYAQRELDEQISGVVVTLVNLYAAALLLSAFLAWFISRWMTRAFELIIRQFGRLNLHRNEPLRWPYDDEIGVLVAEYNKMARKVEESVALLARTERESAFREMARQVAHEIKNPLTPMSLYVQRLQRAIAANEPDAMALAKRVSEALLEQINNLSVIATEFGEFARMSPAKAEELELCELVRNVAEPFAAQAGTRIEFDLPGEALKVIADRSQMVRVVTNLVKNAVQAIPEDREGRIVLSLSQEGGDAVLRVSDNGSGISPEAQEKLFTPYFTTKSSGTGLGLAMTRQMLESWSGSISYETKAGEGTTFIVRMPVAATAPA